MTRLFALEYAGLFDVYNKGLAVMGLPLFLGGTSKTTSASRPCAKSASGTPSTSPKTRISACASREWALRCAHSRRKLFEEASAVFAALVRQRTRWFKGWMQTFIVHCRRPMRLFVELGSRRAVAVLAMFASGLLGPLLGPFLAARMAYDAIFGALLAPAGPLEIALSTLWCFLAIAGAISLILPLAMGMRRCGLTRFRRSLLYLPPWLMMLSIAAWRALYELWRRPFHWEKTEHGLTMRSVLDVEMEVDPFVSREEPLFDQEAGA